MAEEQPLFSCQDEFCRTEHSFPADMLATWEGKPICETCYDDTHWGKDNDDIPSFDQLPKFIPAFQAELARLQRERDQAVDALEYIIDQFAEGNDPLLDEDGDEIDPLEKARATLAAIEGAEQ